MGGRKRIADAGNDVAQQRVQFLSSTGLFSAPERQSCRRPRPGLGGSILWHVQRPSKNTLADKHPPLIRRTSSIAAALKRSRSRGCLWKRMPTRRFRTQHGLSNRLSSRCRPSAEPFSIRRVDWQSHNAKDDLCEEPTLPIVGAHLRLLPTRSSRSLHKAERWGRCRRGGRGHPAQRGGTRARPFQEPLGYSAPPPSAQ